MVYPPKHRQIVEELMGGKFILSNEEQFGSLKENESFYQEFFKVSFDLEKIQSNAVALLEELKKLKHYFLTHF